MSVLSYHLYGEKRGYNSDIFSHFPAVTLGSNSRVHTCRRATINDIYIWASLIELVAKHTLSWVVTFPIELTAIFITS